MTAVALVIFNRPETTVRVFERIRAARPDRLFVIADGPRAGVAGDRERSDAARRVVEHVDWPCDVRRDYADANLGFKRRIETGLARVFSDVDAAIVLEDDCLPDPTFFPFCDELIERYANDERVLSISGNQFIPVEGGAPASYRFSRQPLIWGWATWRRAWRQYDGEMRAWPDLHASGWLETLLDVARERDYWAYLFDRSHRMGDAGSWDYAWQFACWRAGGLAAHPAVNLVTNIGFGADATHCTDPRHIGANVPSAPMAFPLRHPENVERDARADTALEAVLFSGQLGRLMTRLGARTRRS